MAARAHWFEDEDAGRRRPRRPPMRNPSAMIPLEAPARPIEARPERTCILTRRKGTKEELIRLALVSRRRGRARRPRPRARAAARGSASAAPSSTRPMPRASSRARSRARSRPASSTFPPILASAPKPALRQAALDRLGMEARAGNLINGSDKVEAAARPGKVHLLIHAADAGEDGRRTLDQAWRVGGGEPQGLIFPEERTILSMALGRENVVHVALTDPAAAARVRHALRRWQAFIDPDAAV